MENWILIKFARNKGKKIHSDLMKMIFRFSFFESATWNQTIVFFLQHEIDKNAKYQNAV